jgi:hypothetical protein
MSFIPLVLIALAIVVFIVILILVTISLARINSDDDNDSPEDKERYSSARIYLGWAVGIGWAIIGLSILLIVLAIVGLIFFLPEELATAAIPKGLNRGKNGTTSSVIIELEDYRRRIRTGLLGFRSVFNTSGFLGFLEKFALFSILVLLFAFGILATLAAYEIGRTSSRRGYQQAIWAAVLGIIPLSFIIIWAITNYFYVRAEKNKVKALYTEVSAKLNEIELQKYRNRQTTVASSENMKAQENIRARISPNKADINSEAPSFSDLDIPIQRQAATL